MARRESSQAAAGIAIRQLLVAPYEGCIYDPACGSGGMFVQSEEFVESHGGKTGDRSSSEAIIRFFCAASFLDLWLGLQLTRILPG
jgi:hypothetical protein